MATYRHSVQGALPAGDFWTTTMHSDGPASLASAHTAWGTAISAILNGTMKGLLPTTVTATTIVTDELDAVTGRNVAQARGSIVFAGTAAGDPISQRSSILISLRTALPTKAGRGRMYFPCPATDAVTTTGEISAANALAIAGDVGDALGTMASTVTPVIYHARKEDPITVPSVTSITDVLVPVTLATQRRRTNKVPPQYQAAPV